MANINNRPSFGNTRNGAAAMLPGAVRPAVPQFFSIATTRHGGSNNLHGFVTGDNVTHTNSVSSTTATAGE